MGAGVAGIALGVALGRAGLTNFEIFEAEDRVGGTWRANAWPGAGVDNPSVLYQFTFNNVAWRRTHATQPEVLEYLEDTAKGFGVDQHVRLNSRVESVVWDEDLDMYSVAVNGVARLYRVVISAVGFLDDPNIPQWPGLDEFKGAVMHTALWDHSYDFRGKRVAVVGVGSTSAQIVPALEPIVGHMEVFQREPSWVLPKHERVFTPEELRKNTLWRRKWNRWRMALQTEWGYLTGPVYVDGNWRNRKAEAVARGFIADVFRDRLDLAEALTPKYPFSGKRRVVSDDFYPALLSPRVELVPHAVMSASPNGVIDSAGVEHPVDVIILATGFKASKYLSKLPVFGKRHIDIQEVWRDGAYALSGMTLNGFPNFYMMYGPNTNGSGAISNTSLAQQQAAWVVRNLKRMVRHGYTAIDTRERYVRWYNNWLQKRLQRTAWAKANNYTKTATGRIVTQFHGSVSLYWSLLQAFRLLATYGTRLGDRQPQSSTVEVNQPQSSTVEDNKANTLDGSDVR